MKNLIIKLLVVVVAITLTTNLSAKSPNSIVNEIVITNPIKISEVQAMNTSKYDSFFWGNRLNLKVVILEERELKIQADDNKPNETAAATVMVKSLDGTTELGPYTVTEGSILVVVVDQREWVVVEEESTEGAIITHWY